jgi:hypothetical protein
MSELQQTRQIKPCLNVKNLTLLQQTNNKILTEGNGNISDLCGVINWLFIIWFGC